MKSILQSSHHSASSASSSRAVDPVDRLLLPTPMLRQATQHDRTMLHLWQKIWLPFSATTAHQPVQCNARCKSRLPASISEAAWLGLWPQVVKALAERDVWESRPLCLYAFPDKACSNLRVKPNFRWKTGLLLLHKLCRSCFANSHSVQFPL